MINTYETKTITSRQSQLKDKNINLSSLTDYAINTTTLNSHTVEALLLGFGELYREMQEFEEATIYDLIKFDKKTG